MTNLEKQKELAKEAVKLIREFRKEQSQFGDNLLNSVKTKKNGNIIVVDEEYTGKMEFNLSDISSAFRGEMEGFGPCGSAFYDGFDLMKNEASYEYSKMSKKDFIKYVGSIYYVQCRCEEIYERLQEIEKEAEALQS